MSSPHQMLSISVWRQRQEPDPDADEQDPTQAPVCVAMVNRIDLLGTMVKTFHSGSVKETITFACRIAVARIGRGKRAQLALPHELPYDLFIYVRSDGLSCCIITDPEYLPRTVYGLCIDILRLFDASHIAEKLKTVNEDKFLELPQMKEKIDEFQNPEKDSIARVQKQVEDIKDVMRQNIDQVLGNMETLETLSDKSQDLTESSKLFFQNSKKANSCRRRWCEIM